MPSASRYTRSASSAITSSPCKLSSSEERNAAVRPNCCDSRSSRRSMKRRANRSAAWAATSGSDQRT